MRYGTADKTHILLDRPDGSLTALVLGRPAGDEGPKVLPRRLITRALVTVGTVIGVAVAVSLASAPGTDPSVTGAVPQAEAMEGAFSDSPRPGEAIFRVAGLDPGDTVDGTVLVTNDGDRRGLFWLAPAGLDNRLGPTGASMSERLQLSVLDVSERDSPLLVYTGGVEEMGARPLGFIAPGKSRIYNVAATLVAGPSAGASAAPSPYEGSSTTLSLAWNAITGEPPSGEQSVVAPGDRRAPRLRLDFPRRQRLIDTGEVTVLARCDERCDLRATGRLQTSGGPVPAATVTGRAPKGRATPLRLSFEPAARRALRDSLTAGRPVRLKLSVRARDAAGNEADTTRAIWLRPGS